MISHSIIFVAEKAAIDLLRNNNKMKLLSLVTAIILISNNANAQKRGVLLDMETRQPISGASIITNRNKKYTTNYQGHYYIDDPTASSVSFIGKGYVKRDCQIKNLSDTTLLLPVAITLNTVVITAKKVALEGATAPTESYKNMLNDPLMRPKSPSGMSFLGTRMGPKPKVGKKLREKVRKTIESY